MSMGPQTLSDRVECERVIAVTAELYGFTTKEMVGPGRTAELAFARWMAMVECRKRTPWSQKRVGALFNRDHSSVNYAEHRMADWMTIYPSVAKDAAELAKLLNSNNGDSVNK